MVSVKVSAGNELFSPFTLFICNDIMEGHFRKSWCCLYCYKSSVFLLPSLKLYSAKSPFGYPGEITFQFQKNLQILALGIFIMKNDSVISGKQFTEQ